MIFELKCLFCYTLRYTAFLAISCVSGSIVSGSIVSGSIVSGSIVSGSASPVRGGAILQWRPVEGDRQSLFEWTHNPFRAELLSKDTAVSAGGGHHREHLLRAMQKIRIRGVVVAAEEKERFILLEDRLLKIDEDWHIDGVEIRLKSVEEGVLEFVAKDGDSEYMEKLEVVVPDELRASFW